MSKTKKLTRARKAREAAIQESKNNQFALKLTLSHLEEAQEKLEMVQEEWRRICDCIEQSLPQHHVLNILIGRDRALQYKGYKNLNISIEPYRHSRMEMTGDGKVAQSLFRTVYLLETEYKKDWDEFRTLVGVRLADGSHHSRIMLNTESLRVMPTDFLVKDFLTPLVEHMKSQSDTMHYFSKSGY